MTQDKDNKKKKTSKKIEESPMNDMNGDGISSSDLDNNLDEIKKLADDFSMSEEPIENVDQLGSHSQSGVFNGSEDFLDRLNDLGSKQSNENVIESEDLGNFSEPDPTLQSPPFESEDQISFDSDLDNLRTEIINEIEEKIQEEQPEDLSSEDFLDRITSSLEDDPDFKKIGSKPTEASDVFKSFDQDFDESALMEELEQEIINADKAINPFLTEDEASVNDDFIANLDKLTIENYGVDETKNKKLSETELDRDNVNLSSDSWEDLIDSTDEKNKEAVFDFQNEDSFDDFLQKIDGSELEVEFLSLPERITETSAELDDQMMDVEEGHELAEDSEKSVDSLRRSFIDEFDQSAWEEELAKKETKKWLPRTIDSFTNWFRSLNLAEKILILLSFLISVAVIISIFLVVTQWSMNNRKVASPPPAIESTDVDLIYPTGLQLPGGWFFFLQRGEIKNNRWEPINAEWLSNTKLRRVVAIPWSNQSEAVIQSLTDTDEISIYMNNNDIIVYQVEEVMQISRDNVRILSDTEPSLVVILFREDNEDRWAVIAKPK